MYMTLCSIIFIIWTNGCIVFLTTQFISYSFKLFIKLFEYSDNTRFLNIDTYYLSKLSTFITQFFLYIFVFRSSLSLDKSSIIY